MLEKIESGKKYLNSSDELVTVLFKDDVGIYYQRLEGYRNIVSTMYALGHWKELPKQKKRFWLWDVKTNEKSHIVKSAAYMDDEGRASNGCTIYNKDMLIKKHESEFIEVDE